MEFTVPMSESIDEKYWFNIRGCIENYRDINSAKAWLLRANNELNQYQVKRLIWQIFNWTLYGENARDLADPVLTLLSEVDPAGVTERRSLLDDSIRRTLETQRENENIRRLESLRIQKEKLDKVEKERLNSIRLKAVAKEKEELERALALAEQETERLNRQRDELRKIQEEKRASFFETVRLHLNSDFLGADIHFKDLSVHSVSRGDFDAVKRTFVQAWIADNVGGEDSGKHQPPDDEQASAIAAVNGHIQVVARAGSGKTSTLVNRTLFLLKHCGVAPSQMLLLAFNRKAVFEIRRRLLGLLNEGAEAAVVEEIARRRRDATRKNRSVRDDIETAAVNAVAAERNVALPHVMTFHALAHSVANLKGGILFDEPEGSVQGLSRVFQKVINDHLQIPKFLQQIRELMLAHFREDWDRIVDGGYDQSKEELLKFRRSLPRESMGGEYVKSYGEKVIADFLFEHGIAYKYERNHRWSGINYRPDFTIFVNDKSGHENGVIIEYFGLAGDADYDEMSSAKREYWAQKKDWTLIELTPVDITRHGSDAFRSLLQSRLEKSGVPCVKLSEDEIWHRISERAIDRFTKAIVGFIGRCRKLSWTPDELQAHIDAHAVQSTVETIFLKVANRLYGAYLDRLKATGEDDFDGLIERAAENINGGQTVFLRKSGNGDLNALRYICIDEYQDFSDLFFRLLSAIRQQNTNVELFCVGDDWQAINGFAGSDLRFFQDFNKYVGEARKLHISTNYRSSQSIVDIGNALMHGLGQHAVAHKETVGKVLLSDLNVFEPTLLEDRRHPGDCLTPAVLRVANQALAEGRDVVLLCRRNGLPYFVNYGDKTDLEGRGNDRFLSHIRSYFHKGLRERVTISTAHKYKGLEKSVVIVLDAVARSYPLIHPDWVFSRIFGDSPAKITAEERRLLYVALTRAIDTLVVFTDGRGRTPFLEEIERKLPLKPLSWANFPPVAAIAHQRLVVQVRDQKRKSAQSGTFLVKDQLYACRYSWHSVNKVWEKSFPALTFNLDVVLNEVWAASANGVDVTVLNDEGAEVASYKIDLGGWTSRFDNLGVVKENSLDDKTENVK